MARNKSEVSYNFKIDFKGIKDSDIKNKIKKTVGDFLIEETLKQVGEGKTPIDGGAFNKDLTPLYKKVKGKVSGVNFSNMELHGDMLNKLKAKPISTGVEIAIKGKEASKAFAHHTSYRGHPTIKNRSKYKREFIPNKGQKYRKDVLDEVDRIVESYMEDE